MSRPWGGVLGPAHPSRSLTPTSLPGLSPSTAFSTRTRIGVLCRSRATLPLGDPRPQSLALPQMQVAEQCWNSAAPSWAQLATPGGDGRALIQGDTGAQQALQLTGRASQSPGRARVTLALWERRTVLGVWEGAGIRLPGLHPVPLTCRREDSRPGWCVRCCPLVVTSGRFPCCSLGMPPFPREPSQGLCLHGELHARLKTLWTAVLLGAAYS